MAGFDANLTYGPFDPDLAPTSVKLHSNLHCGDERLRKRKERAVFLDCARPRVQDIFDTLEDIGDDFETTAKKLMEYFRYTSFGSCPMKKKHFMIMPLVDYATLTFQRT